LSNHSIVKLLRVETLKKLISLCILSNQLSEISLNHLLIIQEDHHSLSLYLIIHSGLKFLLCDIISMKINQGSGEVDKKPIEDEKNAAK